MLNSPKEYQKQNAATHIDVIASRQHILEVKLCTHHTHHFSAEKEQEASDNDAKIIKNKEQNIPILGRQYNEEGKA